MKRKNNLRKENKSELVRYSRAGDTFHYRWAARRCLKLIYPKTLLKQIVVEGSKESKLAGEYVIDVAEYSDLTKVGLQEIAYYQLKHSVVRKKQPFNLSELKDTITGFAKRYKDFLKTKAQESSIVTFSVVTNRVISESLKHNIAAIAYGGKVNSKFQATFKKYTKLAGKDLVNFCALIRFVDSEGDYEDQRYELQSELTQLLAGTIDSPQVDNIVALVQGKALPDSDGVIRREDILKRFEVTSEKDLYPAPLEIEHPDHIIPRKQQGTILDHIINTTSPVIIHAAGGVGKSVFARQIAESLPIGSLGVIYDCFGGGQYRKRSEPRHRHRDALVQISNELASQGLCSPLIVKSTDQDVEILRAFLARLDVSVKSLKKSSKNAILVILIDAADNAEMAAIEYSEKCFVHELLRESMPDACRLVALCRTERVDLLRPTENISQLELETFSEEETLSYLKMYFPEATKDNGNEFHRLTNNGNPRVQANALSLGLSTLTETLGSLGPLGTTIEKQIEGQLNAAISLVKDKLPDNYQKHIDAICLGLATLPPFIPLSVLSKAANVDEATVKSFIADLGRPLWLTDTSVHFRDEPTETWFRQKFSATPDQIATYITRLEPLASKYSYVAETLPSLYLNAGKYSELVNLALSDNLLPKDNPINERNVRVYRLQFAFKAALKLKNYADASKLALRAGEEVAGDKRQLDLLKKNIDLIAPLQYEQKVQELAFRRLIHSKWEGSENVYSAALLSSVEDFKGEARGFLRAAFNWLNLYFEARKKEEKNHAEDRLTDDDIVEFASAIFNLDGSDKLVSFLFSWNHPHLTYRIGKKFFRRLIDANKYSSLKEILSLDFETEHLRNQYLVMAIADELLNVGLFPSAKSTRRCLDLLASKNTRIPKPVYQYKDTTLSALISFIEVCTANRHSKTKILQILNHYIPKRASRLVSDNYTTEERDNFLRALALRCVLEKNFEPDLDKLISKEFLKKKNTYKYDQEIREFKERVGALLPWYIVRARLFINDIDDLVQAAQDADDKSKKALGQRYRDSDTMPYEISRVWLQILTLCQNSNTSQIKKFSSYYLKDNKKIWIHDLLKAVRSAFRLDHLSGIRRELELSARDLVASLKDEGPETKAEWYIDIARAVLPASNDDAAVYFEYAIEAVSKFGDELVQRWEAVVALAKRSAEGGYSSPEIAYRFIRCAELVGDNVAREKHWDRSGAVRICARLSPVSALAALSRWRDRDVGWFDSQLQALADEVVTENIVTPEIGWSLSAFFEGYGLEDFASLCIEKASSTEHRQLILDMAVRDLRLNEATEGSLQKLKKVVNQYSISNSNLDTALAFYAAKPKTKEGINKPLTRSSHYKESKPVDWANLFNGVDVTTSSGISESLNRFKTDSIKTSSFEEFWQELFKRVNENDSVKFLHALIQTEKIDRFDIQTALSSLPKDWHQKASVKKHWGKILQAVARRLTLDFINRWSLRYFLEKVSIKENEVQYLRQGILEGLSGNIELTDANTFFGFSDIISPFISPKEATELLDFALSRFELHIDPQYADGSWAEWLNPPTDITSAFTGLIWAALGSPRAEIRWRAAHCIRRLAEHGCRFEIDALVQWMELDNVGAFGSNKFPFYNLHARQYLLIALARISVDNVEILKRHCMIFSRLALTTTHLLIQRFSAQIAINIEKSFPNTYDHQTLIQLNQVGRSQIPAKEIDGHKEDIDSYWHSKGLVDTSLKHLHGWDFDSYWFEPLGRIFGIAGKQVQELASEVIIKNWQVTHDGSFDSDPRSVLWRSSRNERETWHDHGSYPRTDNYSFYLSYHSMLVVAAKLVEKMPVVKRPNWDEGDPWGDWFKWHSLTRDDGRWLSDRRDPAPLTQPDWVDLPKNEKWRSEISQGELLESIFFENQDKTWLHVSGYWEEGYAERKEEIHVHTALVSPSTSQSLINALATYSDSHDYKLPEYQETEWEIDTPPFKLKGWIWRDNTSRCLDAYDPFASQIPYPPYQIGNSIIEKLGLTEDIEQRRWCLPDADEASLICELWSTNKPRPEDDPLRRGERISASLDFLKRLCLTQECEIVFEVQINRRFPNSSYTNKKGDNGYKPPITKIYIFSADGSLRDTETNHKIR